MNKKNIYIILSIVLSIVVLGIICCLIYGVYKFISNKIDHPKFRGGVTLGDIEEIIKKQYINSINIYSKGILGDISETSYSINALDFLDGPDLENINGFKIYFIYEPSEDGNNKIQFEIIDALERYIKEHHIELFINGDFKQLMNFIIRDRQNNVWETWLNDLFYKTHKRNNIEYRNDIVKHLRKLYNIIFDETVYNFFQFQLGNNPNEFRIKKAIFINRRDVIENAKLINNDYIKKNYYITLNNNNQLGVIQPFIGFKINNEIFLAWNRTNIEKNNIYIMQANERDNDKLYTLNMNIEENNFSLKFPLGELIGRTYVNNNHSITASFWDNNRFVILKPINIYQYQYENGWVESLNYIQNIIEVLKLLTISIEDDGLYLLKPQYVFQNNYAKIHELYAEIFNFSIRNNKRVKLRLEIRKTYGDLPNCQTLLENSQFFIIGSETTYYMIAIYNYKRLIIKFKQNISFETQFSNLGFNDFDITIIENINDIIDDIRTNLKLIINYNEEYSKRDILMPIIDAIKTDTVNYEKNYLFKYALNLNDGGYNYKILFNEINNEIVYNYSQSFFIDKDFNLYLRSDDTASQIIIPYSYNNVEKKYVLNLNNIITDRRTEFWGEKINGIHISFGGRYQNVIYETNHIIIENLNNDHNRIPPYMLKR